MKTLFCLVLAVTAGAAHPADHRDPQVARVVSYADLDLARPAGVATLHARIRSAASFVCRAPFDERAPKHVAAARACVEQAVTRALADVQSANALAADLHATVANTAAPHAAVAMLSPLQR